MGELEKKVIEGLKEEGYSVLSKEEKETIMNACKTINDILEGLLKKSLSLSSTQKTTKKIKTKKPHKEKAKSDFSDKEEKVYLAIKKGASTTLEIAKKSGIKYGSVNKELTNLLNKKQIKKAGWGKYAPTSEESSEEIEHVKTDAEKIFENKLVQDNKDLLSALNNGKEWFGDLLKATSLIGPKKLRSKLDKLIAIGVVERIAEGKYRLVNKNAKELPENIQKVYDAIKEEIESIPGIMEKTMLKRKQIDYCLVKLIKRNLIKKVSVGKYALFEEEPKKEIKSQILEKISDIEDEEEGWDD